MGLSKVKVIDEPFRVSLKLSSCRSSVLPYVLLLEIKMKRDLKKSINPGLIQTGVHICQAKIKDMLIETMRETRTLQGIHERK
jgi:hypothetical protein